MTFITYRLHANTGGGAWCPSAQINASSHEWIQVEFPTLIVISAVETQGRWDRGRGMEYPVAYMIEYWRDSLGQWARYKDGQGNEVSGHYLEASETVLLPPSDTIFCALRGAFLLLGCHEICR